MIDSDKLAILRAAFERGDTARAASVEARVRYKDGLHSFARFVGAGVPRARRVQRGRGGGRFDPPIPAYNGPDWIGKAAD